ncbi:VOC family protein [Methylobacterium trifolii]
MDYRCDHLHLRSRDAVSAAGFYVAAFAAREVRREGEPVSRVVIDLGGLPLFIEQAPEGLRPTAEPPHLGIEHIGLRVADLEAAMAEVAARGIPVVSGITAVRPGLRVAFLEGPDSVRIELLERTPVS